ncbi:hypothetical protein GGH12_005318 [Coemansia sp. RSA 1822]|nr:hypothetical protein IW147_005120 [Coemansia sp. RSA 720]KAJ2559596.1 hypothetical protein GGH12_005318 [Coemansia sp. RSA 1822]
MLSKVSVPSEFQIPGSGQLREWKQLCYESGDDASPSRNMHYALAAMDQAMALRLVKWMEAWTLMDKLRQPEGMWLWYLILKLDNLLDHDDTHVLRELCRKLKLIRSNIGHNIVQNPEHLLVYRADEIAAINILITSVTRGYRQRDLEND